MTNHTRPSANFLHAANQLVFEEASRVIERERCLIAADLDGTIAYTEHHQMTAFASLVTTCTGVELSFKDVANEMLGKTEKDIISILKNRHGIEGDLDDLVDQRGQLYYNSVLASDLDPNPHVVSLCHLAQEKWGEKPIVVSNGRQNIQSGLLSHWGIKDLFGTVNTSDTMCPDLPLQERKRAFIAELPAKHNLDPSRIIVVEDSASMARFAEDNGMTAIFVHHRLNKPYVPKSGLMFWCGSHVKAPTILGGPK